MEVGEYQRGHLSRKYIFYCEKSLFHAQKKKHFYSDMLVGSGFPFGTLQPKKMEVRTKKWVVEGNLHAFITLCSSCVKN